jgi:oligoendopeptidase F
MNAAGLHRDVETMVHEAGHAFHSQLCAEEPLVHYRHSPIEFAEVASMSMELLTMTYWDEFYDDPTDLARAKRRQIENSVVLLPWVATIDAFQHWLYANPSHTRDERTSAWLDLDRRFGHDVSWDGIEHVLARVWQRQPHLFDVPFYYIEYAIAQLGALQLWALSLEEGEDAAVEHYKRALSIGGARALPSLFQAAHIRFDFGAETIGRLAERVTGAIDRLPA